MDNENMNGEHTGNEDVNSGSMSSESVVVGGVNEEKNPGSDDIIDSVSTEIKTDSSESSTYHLEKDSIPVQKEYVSAQADPNGQMNSTYRQDTTYQQGTPSTGSSYVNNPYNQTTSSGNDYTAPQGAVKPKKEKKAKIKKQGSGKAKKVCVFVGKAAAFGLVAGGVMFGVNTLGNKATGANVKHAEVKTVTTADSGMKDNSISGSDVADVAEEVMPSIVSITNTSVQVVRSWFQSYEQEVEGAGSGIIIGQTDKEILIATNNHVIDGAKELTVSFSDETAVEATVKGVDKAMDLAVIAIDVNKMEEETLNKIKVAALGSSDDLRVGESAIAIGNALGYGQSVTVGYISALEREVDADGKTMKLLQTDAAINPGNSGGALLNSKGEVIGINTMKFVDSTVEGMGYAIPISKAIPIINDLMNEKVIKESEQGYLGIRGSDSTDEYAKNFNMPNGVYVVKILEDSPADKCGLKAGDIITKFGDRDVSTMEELQSVLSKKEAGEEIEMVIQRNNEKGEYKEITLKVKLGAKKDMPADDENDKSKKSDNNSKSSDDNEQEQDNNENSDESADDSQDNGADVPQEDGNNYQQVDPEDFFREFEEYFGR